jgi:hypothetical protein
VPTWPQSSFWRSVYADRTISPSAYHSGSATRPGSTCGPPSEFGPCPGAEALQIMPFEQTPSRRGARGAGLSPGSLVDSTAHHRAAGKISGEKLM